MSDGLQRTCPKCQELNPPHLELCQACGVWLVPHERVRGSKLARVHEDLATVTRALGVSIAGDDPERFEPRRIVDPERGDTGQGAPTIPPRKEG